MLDNLPLNSIDLADHFGDGGSGKLGIYFALKFILIGFTMAIFLRSSDPLRSVFKLKPVGRVIFGGADFLYCSPFTW